MFTIFKGIIDLIVKLLYSLAANWFYLLLAFIAPLTIYYVSQGEEIVRELTDKTGYLVHYNLLLVFISFLVLFHAVWVIPVSSINLVFRLLKGSRRCDDLEDKWNAFKLLASTYNTRKDGHKLIPIRIFANIPFYIFTYLLIVLDNKEGRSLIYFLIFLFCSLLVAELLKRYMIKLQDKNQFIFGLNINPGTPYYGYLMHLFLVFLVLLFWNEDYFYLSIFFLWLLCLWNDLFHKFIEMISPKEKIVFNCKDDILRKSWNVYIVHWIVVIVFIIAIAVLHINYQLNQLSAIVVMNIVFSFYIMLMDLLIKTPLDLLHFLSKEVHSGRTKGNETNEVQMVTKLQEAFIGESPSIVSKSKDPSVSKFDGKKFDYYYWLFRILNLGVTFVLIYVIFISSANDHKMRREIIGQEEFNLYSKRDSLKEFYNGWKKVNGNPDTVILIAALGGGSRAGYWTGIHLDRIKQQITKVDTNSKIFAISSISGGTSGANMFIAKSGMELLKYQVKSDSDSFWRKIYGYNFVSSALWGLLINDGLMGWIDKNSIYDRDRNYTRQQEEFRAFVLNYKKPMALEKAKSFFDRDYMLRYSDENYLYQLPVHLINTAKVQNGMRTVIAPFPLDTHYFHNVVDLYQRHLDHQNNCRNYSFPAATAVGLSQSFPLVSAYNYLECVGTFMDGGQWENSGLHTISDLYRQLKNIDSFQCFKVIYISNGDSDNESTKKVNSVVLQTIKSASSSPFSGHTLYWERAVKDMVINKDAFVHIRLVDSTGKAIKIPLGVLLSDKSMNTMYQNFKN